jgi:hypothetical protein
MLLVPPGLDRGTGPDRRTAVRGLLGGAFAQGMVLWLAIAGFGLLLVGPFKGWDHSESDLNRSLQDTRSQRWDSVTALSSHVGNTEIIIGVCIVVVAVVWWRTRRWWFAVIPAIAISLQATIFRHRVGRYRSLTPGRSASEPGPTDVELPQRPHRRQRRAIHLAGRHGHNNRADLAAPDRDRRVLGHPLPRPARVAVPGHAPSQRRNRGRHQRLGLCRAHRRLPGPPAQRDHRDRWSARQWQQTWPKRMTLKTSTGRR